MMDIQSVWIALTLIGLGGALWLALLWQGRSGGWPADRARPVVVAALAVAVVFALLVVAPVLGLQTSRAPAAATRLLLFGLPLAWLWMARQITARVVPTAGRWLGWSIVALAGAMLVIAVALPLTDPARLTLSGLYFPAYVLILLLLIVSVGLIVWQRWQHASSALERSMLPWLVAGTLFLFVGGFIGAGDLTLGLAHPAFARLTSWLFPAELRLLSAISLLLVLVSLHQVARTQAQAEGAPYLVVQHAAWRVGAGLLLLFLAVGAVFVWLWGLPAPLLGLMALLALLAEPVAHMLTRRSQPLLSAGTTRRQGPASVPPAVYGVLSRIARQLNLRQLGLATPAEGGRGFVIVAALNPAWEGERLDVRNVSAWEERGLSGWNLPLKKNGRTVAVLASGGGSALSDAQRHLAQAGGAQLVALLDAWQALDEQHQALQAALSRFEGERHDLEAQIVSAAQPLAPPDLRHAVRQALTTWSNDEALRQSDLASSTLLSRTPVAQRPAAIRELLYHLIDQLRPYENEAAPLVPTAEWRPHLLLKQLYVEQIPREEVEAALGLSGRSAQRVEQRAVDTVARTLAELEAGARQLGDGSLPALSGRNAPPLPPSRSPSSHMAHAAASDPSRRSPASTRSPQSRPAPPRRDAPDTPLGALSERFMESARKMKPSRQSAPSSAPRTSARRGGGVAPPRQGADDPHPSSAASSTTASRPRVTRPEPDPDLPASLQRPRTLGQRRTRPVPKPAPSESTDEPPPEDDETPIEYD